MRLVAAVSGLAIMALVACSSGKNTVSRTAVPSVTAVSSRAPGNAVAVPGTAVVSAQGATGTGNAAVEDRLTKAALQKSDLPAELEQANRQALTNKQYAAEQTDAAAFQQVLDRQGRISGVTVQFLAQATPQPNAPGMFGMLELLSTWQNDAGAKAGLAETLKAVMPQGAQPNTVKVETEPVDLGAIGDEVVATHLRVTPLTPGQPVNDAYIIGLRKGKDTVILILSGVNGAPALDLAKRLTTLQVQRLN
jgi:hypothetical protein